MNFIEVYLAMKNKLMILTLLVAVSAAFVGCGANTDNSPDISVTGVDSIQYKDTISEKSDNRKYSLELDGENSIVLNHEYAGIEDTSTDYINIAADLLESLDLADRISGCQIRINSEVKKEINGKTYSLVDDKHFTFLKDVEAFLCTYLTEAFISEKYFDITGSDIPCVTEIDNQLYLLDEQRDSGFKWIKINNKPDITVLSTADDNFEVSASYNTYHFGSDTYYINVGFRKENGFWKVDSLNQPENDLSW